MTVAPRTNGETITDQPAVSPESTGAAAVRPRPARRGPADLPFTFADHVLASELAARRDEPDWLRAERLEGARRFQELPVETNHLYTTYVDLRAAELADVRPYLVTGSGPAERASLPADAAAVVEVRDDEVAGIALGPEVRGSGVVIETFGSLLRSDERMLRALLEGGSSLPADDKFAQLARGFWNQGLVIHVPDGVRLERPIVLRWLAGRPGTALLSRTLVSLGRDAVASIVEELADSGHGPTRDGAQNLFTGTLEVNLGPGASLAVASLQELAERSVAFQHRTARIGAGAQMRWALAHLGGGLVKTRVDNRLEGDGGFVEQIEIVFGSGTQLFDLTSYTRHVGRDTTGTVLSKGAMLDSARAYMKGLITIERSAHGTDSFLGEFGMHLTKRARSVAIPSLEIDQPDVRRAAHSSSVGPIDEAQIFYLMSRGLTREDARKFITLGFLEPVVARVPLAAAQDRLREVLERKWSDSESATAVAA